MWVNICKRTIDGQPCSGEHRLFPCVLRLPVLLQLVSDDARRLSFAKVYARLHRANLQHDRLHCLPAVSMPSRVTLALLTHMNYTH